MKLSSVYAVFFALLILDAALALGQQQQQQQQEQEENPFAFEERHFETRFQEQRGRVRVLPRFARRSELLRGIDNYRLGVLEAEPNTFIVPNHVDAELLVFVKQGNGVVSLLLEDRRESFDIRRGDIFRVPAGITHYIVNKDNNRRLVLVEFIQPISNPGQYEPFFGAGAENPESSFYRAFSKEVLEATFKAKEDEISRIFGQKRRGLFVEASEEQIRALSQHQGSGIWPFRHGQSQEITFNILEKRPTQSNQFGQLSEVDNNDYQPLQELNVAVSFVNITRGGMTAPVYNSKAWKLAVILNEKDDGYFELARPQVSSRGSERESRGAPRYQRASGQLRRDTVVIVPPGHPAVFVASGNRNLEVISFEINAFRNEKIPLAGRGNVYNQLESVAKTLSFGAPGREVEAVFNRNRERFFFEGPQQQPQQQQEEGGGSGEGELKMVV